MAPEGFGGTAHYLGALVGKTVLIELMNGTRGVRGELESVFTDAVVLKVATGTQLIFVHAIYAIREYRPEIEDQVTSIPEPW